MGGWGISTRMRRGRCCHHGPRTIRDVRNAVNSKNIRLIIIVLTSPHARAWATSFRKIWLRRPTSLETTRLNPLLRVFTTTPLSSGGHAKTQLARHGGLTQNGNAVCGIILFSKTQHVLWAPRRMSRFL